MSDKNDFVIIYGDSDYPTFGKNFWCGNEGDMPDSLLIENQKDYPELNIERVKVSDILKSNNTDYKYIKDTLVKKIS
jgi:hypothetical protein